MSANKVEIESRKLKIKSLDRRVARVKQNGGQITRK